MVLLEAQARIDRRYCILPHSPAFTMIVRLIIPFSYGVRLRGTHLLEDQLGRADAGSWQIADGGATQKAAAGGTSVGDLRVRFVVEL